MILRTFWLHERMQTMSVQARLAETPGVHLQVERMKDFQHLQTDEGESFSLKIKRIASLMPKIIHTGHSPNRPSGLWWAIILSDVFHLGLNPTILITLNQATRFPDAKGCFLSPPETGNACFFCCSSVGCATEGSGCRKAAKWRMWSNRDAPKLSQNPKSKYS